MVRRATLVVTALSTCVAAAYAGFRWGRDAGESSMQLLDQHLYWTSMDRAHNEMWIAQFKTSRLQTELAFSQRQSDALRERMTGLASLSRVAARQVVSALGTATRDDARALIRSTAMLEELADAIDV